jgi:hypothetical protein
MSYAMFYSKSKSLTNILAILYLFSDTFFMLINYPSLLKYFLLFFPDNATDLGIFPNVSIIKAK